MEIIKKNSITLFFGIISCFSFAQKKEVVIYTRGFSTIVFYNDSTFIYREGSRSSMKIIDYLDSDTINHGTYIKEKKCYTLYSHEKSSTKDSILCEKIVPVISKRKIMLNNAVFLEWKYYHKKEKRSLQKKQKKW